MRNLKQLFENNEAWAARMVERDPQFFERLSKQQAPEYLWIGCSDSRVPANEIVGLLPGEMFVHRNVANVVAHTDLNCLAVLQYAVEALRVKHIIVCGHYGCGGVQAAVRNDKLGLIDNWLRRVQETRSKHHAALEGVRDEAALCNRMCELNVIEQVYNVSRTTIVEDAWLQGQSLTVHGWIYSLKDGLLRDLGMCVSGKDEIAKSYDAAVEAVAKASRQATPKATTQRASTAKPSTLPESAPPPATPPPAPMKITSESRATPPPLPRLK
ncbi:MAG: carbonic anhydrase [Candidatus Hydrogenedentota bacterium]